MSLPFRPGRFLVKYGVLNVLSQVQPDYKCLETQ